MLAFVSDTGVFVVVLAVILLFGTSQIPKLARNLGEAGRELRKAQADPDAARPEAAGVSASVAAHPSVPQVTLPLATPVADDRITLTPAQLEALLAARQAQPVDHS